MSAPGSWVNRCLWRVTLAGVLLAGLNMLVSCGGVPAQPTSPPQSPTPGPGPSPAPAPSPTPGSLPQIALSTVVSGLDHPVGLVSDGSERMFVVEQPGEIRIIQNGALLSQPFLDIRSKITFGGEAGLVGLAFHPSYASNRQFYIDYTRTVNGQLQSVIAQYTASATNPNQAEAASEKILLTFNQPYDNHNGGQLVFGADGFLYISSGDGGSEGDPQGNGQKLSTMLGKILRIDVDHAASGKAYAIPSGNPFASGGGLPEIFAYGFRNPWRCSFDTPTGRMFCADVGGDMREEVDLVEAGKNYGWNVMEGTQCFQPSSGCNQSGLTLPIIDYPHSEGECVVGGYVYHGSALPALVGAYVFGDFVVGKIWALTEDSSGKWTKTLMLDTGRPITSFGTDSSGEIYLTDYNGLVLKVVPK